MNQQVSGNPLAAAEQARLRAEFPLIAAAEVVYLDNAATTQKPQTVIDAISAYYEHDNANVHRAAHKLADRATRAFEAARASMQALLGAASREEIIWTRGTTEAINLVAQTWGDSQLEADQEILISASEHHSNIVPWQLLCERRGARLVVCPLHEDGSLNLTEFDRLLNERTALVAIGHVSNALGTVHPIADLCRRTHAAGALMLVDGAQAVGHLPVDVSELGVDFYACSGHKMFGPTGVGVLYGRRALLETLPPWQAGGEMIERVSFTGTMFNALPYRFEAGTPNIAGSIGMGVAADYLLALDRPAVQAYEDQLLRQATSRIAQLPGVRLVGTAADKSGVLSFVVDGAHPQDIGTLLDQQNIAVRVGHHCAMPLMEQLGLPGTVRASFSLYNNEDDVARFVAALDKTLSFL